MTHEEYKKIVEALNIKYVQVIVNEIEYEKFKEIDLFSDQQEVFEEIDELLEEDNDFEEKELISKLSFWLDLNDDFKIINYTDLFSDTEAYVSFLIYDETNDFEFDVKNQITLSFDAFIKLIS